MGKYLNIGNDGFRAIRKGRYIDKTGMISFINTTLGTKRKLTCVSRPRRFGKSFAAQMLCAYYDKSCDSRELFAGCEIEKTSSFERYLNQYDVIYLDITLFIAIAADIRNVVLELQEKVATELWTAYPEAKKGQTLLEMISNVNEATGNKFIVIIDEWDALFREAKKNTELQKEYIKLLRSLFKSSLTDKVIEAAYMTGILPIKKYGTQSALTDFEEYTMLRPWPLEKYVGFVEEEVQSLCGDSRLGFPEMQDWYDGYVLGDGMHVYSPESVLDALRRGRLGSYWTQTETYESLKFYIEMNEDGLKETIVQMLGGAHCKIDADTFQNDMTSIGSRDDVLTLLVHLGYLAYDEEEEAVFIPNKEVRQEFIRAVRMSKHKEAAKLILASDQLLADTLSGNNEAVAQAIERAHSAGTTPLSYNNEQALRSVIRFAYLSCIDEFMRIEELPSGIGFADVVYLPKKGSAMPILVIELKWYKSVQGAISQIKDRNYPQVLEGFGSDILLVGISYDEKNKHTCLIEKYKKNKIKYNGG